LELGGLAAAIGGRAMQGGKNKALGKQISILGRTAMGLGATTNLFAGNVPEALVFGGILGMGGLKNLGKVKDVKTQQNKKPSEGKTIEQIFSEKGLKPSDVQQFREAISRGNLNVEQKPTGNLNGEQKPTGNLNGEQKSTENSHVEQKPTGNLWQDYYRTVVELGALGVKSKDLKDLIVVNPKYTKWDRTESFDPEYFFSPRFVRKDVKKLSKGIKLGELMKLAYNAYIMPDYARIEEEEEERRRAAKRAWRTYAAISGLAGAGMVAIKGNNKTWANIGRALSASSLAASLGTGSWATAGTNGALWGLSEWLRPKEQKNNQQNNGGNPPQPSQPPTGGNQQDNANVGKQEKAQKSAADLSTEILQKTAMQQIQLIQTFQAYYMLKSAQDTQLEISLKEQLVKTAAPLYEGYSPGLYYDEYEERRRRRREARNLFNTLTWGGLAANVAANFVKDPVAKKQLNTIGRWTGWGGILGNTLSGNFGDALAGMSGRATAWGTMRALRKIENKDGGGGFIEQGQKGLESLWGKSKDFFSNLFKSEQNNNNMNNNNPNNDNPNNDNPNNQPPTAPKEEEKANAGANK
jgi:hypothetical protein